MPQSLFDYLFHSFILVKAGQGWRPRGATPRPRSSGCADAGRSRGATPRSMSGGATVRRYPPSKVGAAAGLCWSSREEIPHAQGKRNPSKTVGVARGHQRADTLKPYSEKSSQSNHTRTTALSNSMKPCSPRDSQESSPTPQFKSINSLVLSFLYCPTLISTHDHRKNHSLD